MLFLLQAPRFTLEFDVALVLASLAEGGFAQPLHLRQFGSDVFEAGASLCVHPPLDRLIVLRARYGLILQLGVLPPEFGKCPGPLHLG